MIKKSNRVFEKIAILTFCVFCSISLIVLQLEKNDLKENSAELQTQINELQEYADELQAALDEPFNQEYIEEIAKSKLGLRYPQEVIFYSDATND